MQPIVSLREALTDEAYLGGVLGAPSWRNWRILLIAAMGERLEPDEFAIFQQLTQRQAPPAQPVDEGWFVIGRRGGKSRAIACLAVYVATLCRHPRVPAGEPASVICVAGSRRQARITFKYITTILQRRPELAREVERLTADTIDLRNGISIEVFPATDRARGTTAVAVIADEVATWGSTDDSVLPDDEIVGSILRPTLASTEGPFIAISSPHARRGVLWQTYRDHFGQAGDPILVAQAETRIMNPRISERWLARQFALDPVKAAAEYGVAFRTDVESLFTIEAIAACTDDVRDRPPQRGIVYTASCDPSGGAGDGFALGISHGEGKGVVLDHLDEVQGRLNPLAVVRRFADVCHRYQVYEIFGDAYSAQWAIAAFRDHGIEYRHPPRLDGDGKLNKSQLFLEFLPLVNARQVTLLRNERLERQLCLLERSSTRGGRDVVDHPRGAHDDLAQAAALALVMAMQRGALVPAYRLQTYSDPYDSMREWDDPGYHARAAARQSGYFSGPGWAPTLHGGDDEQQQAYGIDEERRL